MVLTAEVACIVVANVVTMLEERVVVSLLARVGVGEKDVAVAMLSVELVDDPACVVAPVVCKLLVSVERIALVDPAPVDCAEMVGPADATLLDNGSVDG